MSLAIPLRGDFDAMTLRRLAKGSKDAAQTRRLLALAAIRSALSFAPLADVQRRRQRVGAHAEHVYQPPSADTEARPTMREAAATWTESK